MRTNSFLAALAFLPLAMLAACAPPTEVSASDHSAIAADDACSEEGRASITEDVNSGTYTMHTADGDFVLTVDGNDATLEGPVGTDSESAIPLVANGRIERIDGPWSLTGDGECSFVVHHTIDTHRVRVEPFHYSATPACLAAAGVYLDACAAPAPGAAEEPTSSGG